MNEISLYNEDFRKLFPVLLEENKTFISIEVCPSKKVDIDELKILRPAFCAVTWNFVPKPNTQISPKNIPSIQIAAKLIAEKIPVLLHLNGRNFSSKDVITILEEAKACGVKNILALKGGNIIFEL